MRCQLIKHQGLVTRSWLSHHQLGRVEVDLRPGHVDHGDTRPRQHGLQPGSKGVEAQRKKCRSSIGHDCNRVGTNRPRRYLEHLDCVVEPPQQGSQNPGRVPAAKGRLAVLIQGRQLTGWSTLMAVVEGKTRGVVGGGAQGGCE